MTTLPEPGLTARLSPAPRSQPSVLSWGWSPRTPEVSVRIEPDVIAAGGLPVWEVPCESIVSGSQLALGRLPVSVPAKDWLVMTFSAPYGEVQSEWTKLKSPMLLWAESAW